MKLLFLSIVSALLFTLISVGCSSKNVNNSRSVYMLLHPSKETLKEPQKLQKTFEHVINDMSPGDSIAIHADNEILSIDFSKDHSKAYVQKRDFRRKVIDYIHALKPKIASNFLPSLQKAKLYLDRKIALHKSIIYCNPYIDLNLKEQDLEGYTISMIDFFQTLNNISALKQKIENAKGRFVVASSLSELNDALSFK